MKFYKMYSEELLFADFTEEEEAKIISILKAIYSLNNHWRHHVIVDDLSLERTMNIASATGKKTYDYKVVASHQTGDSKVVFSCHIDNLDAEPRCLVETFINTDWVDTLLDVAKNYPLSTSFA